MGRHPPYKRVCKRGRYPPYKRVCKRGRYPPYNRVCKRGKFVRAVITIIVVLLSRDL